MKCVCVCVCARARVRVRVRGCVCARACVCVCVCEWQLWLQEVEKEATSDSNVTQHKPTRVRQNKLAHLGLCIGHVLFQHGSPPVGAWQPECLPHSDESLNAVGDAEGSTVLLL